MFSKRSISCSGIFPWRPLFFLFLVAILATALVVGCGQSGGQPAAKEQSQGAQKSESSSKAPESKPPSSSNAQESKPAAAALTSAGEIAMYQGADRQERFAKEAQKEGSVSWFTSMVLPDSKPISEAFEKKYNVKVELWRAQDEDISQKIRAEGKAGVTSFDIVETAGPTMEILSREKLITPFFSPYLADFPPQSKGAGGYWQSDRVNLFVQAYNTKLVSKDELPKSYDDLMNPRWKGRIGVEGGNYDWFATVVKSWGEDKGLSYFKRLTEQDLQVRTGNSALADLLAAGEVPFAIAVYNHRIQALKDSGAPVDWFVIDKAVARPNGVAVAAKAKHPYAAMLFADFMLSPEGQGLIMKAGRVPTSTKVESPLMKGVNYIQADIPAVVDEFSKWQKIYDDLFMNKAR